MKMRNLMAVILPVALTVAAPALVRAADDDTAAAADQQQSAQPHERHHRDRAQHVQKRLDKLKADLQIKADQEAQWSTFSNAVMQQMSEFKAARETMGAMPTRAPERIDRQVQMMKQRVASFETIAQAAKTLYAALTPDQQQVADKRLLNFHHRAG